MSNEFTPTTNTTEPTEGLYESVDELRAKCAGADMHDPYDREKLYGLIAKATRLSSIATALNADKLADRCSLYADRLRDTLNNAGK